MTDTGEEREAESTPLEEPVEEVQISEGRNSSPKRQRSEIRRCER